MRKVVLTIMLATLLGGFARAQSIFEGTYIYFTPTRLIPLYIENPIIRFGVEKQFFEKHGVLFEAGYGKNFWGLHYTCFQLRGSYKYYVVRTRPTSRFYIFLDVFYNNFTKYHLSTDGYYEPNSDNYVTYDKATQKIPKIGGNIGIGFFRDLSKRLHFDFCLGIGAASRTVSYSDVVNPTSQYRAYEASYFFNRERNEPMTTNVFSVKTGISIVYKINIKEDLSY